MKLRAGDLVKLSPLAGGFATLRTDPMGEWGIDYHTQPSVVATWGENDVGVVVALERSDGRNVFISSHKGSGWVSGAYLEIVR